MPHVSVIIPAYNQAQFLGGAIQSVLDQSYNDYEIIVIDDGSTDNTKEVAAQFGERVRYIWQENKGLAGARNTGIRAAKGELIGLLDSDDQWLPVFLETMVTLASRHPQAAVYYCGAQCMDVDDNTLPQTMGTSITPLATPDAMYQTLLRANFIIPSTTILRRSIIILVGLFDQELRSCEDWDLWLRILPEYDFVASPDPLVRYRVHSHSLSANPSGMQQAKSAVIRKHFGPDDGQQQNWSADKRRAYGGLYRYYILTSVQRQDNWQTAPQRLRRALRVDPTLSADRNFFYDLALGSQPAGYRGALSKLQLKKNGGHMNQMLADTFDSSIDGQLQSLRSSTYGTAYYALGLVAYNTGQLSLSRRFLFSALRFRPDLRHNRLVVGNLMKSFAGQTALDKMKDLRLKAR